MINRYFDLTWGSYALDPSGVGQSPKLNNARECSVDDIGQEIYDTGLLLLCPPNTGIYMFDKFLKFFKNQVMFFSVS